MNNPVNNRDEVEVLFELYYDCEDRVICIIRAMILKSFSDRFSL
jgi:hypothetical protein